MKTILITGGAVRIGRKIAEYFLQHQHQIIIHCNNSYSEALHLQELYPQIKIVRCDFHDPNQVHNLFNEINHLDVLINNASLFQNDTLLTFTKESFYGHINVNTLAPIILTQQFANKFQKGHVINILDTWAADLPKNFLSYTLSKNALRDFTLTASLPKISVNGISLGFTLYKEGFPIAFFEKMQSKYQSSVEDICQTIDFILSTNINNKVINLCQQQ